MKFTTILLLFQAICLIQFVNSAGGKHGRKKKNRVVPIHTISLDAIAVLINCHEKFIRQGIPLPKEHGTFGFYLMEPYFKIEEFFMKCIEEKKGISSIKIITDLYTKYIGKNEWIKGQKDSLQKLHRDHFKIEDMIERNKKLERWRMGVVGLGLAVKHLHYLIANKLMQKGFMEIVKIHENEKLDKQRYKDIEMHINDSVENIFWILSKKSEEESNKDFTYEKYEIGALMGLKTELSKIILEKEMPANFKDFWFIKGKDTPKVKRILWVVRHAQRLDNVDPENYKGNRNDVKEKEYNGQKFWWDNNPLSPHGFKQAETLHKVFSQIPIHLLFSSPLQRTVQTSKGIFGIPGEENMHKNLSINLEPGFLERLDGCRIPPSYQNCEELKNNYSSKIDCNYSSLYTKLEHGKKSDQLILPSETEGKEKDENDCIDRIKNTLNYVLKNVKVSEERKIEAKNIAHSNSWLTEGEKLAENIVVVSHGAPIGAIHQIISGQWSCVAQTSISKFVEFENTEEPSSKYYSEYKMKEIQPDGKESGEYKNFRLVYTTETKHLNLRTAF